MIGLKLFQNLIFMGVRATLLDFAKNTFIF